MHSRKGYDMDRQEGKCPWLSRLKGWFTVSEPSTQALKQHKKLVYANSGVTRNDPQAHVKLHLPASTIPDDAIKPTSGPDPDDLARKRHKERRVKKQLSPDSLLSSGSWSPKAPSVDSSIMSSQQSPGPRSSFFPG